MGIIFLVMCTIFGVIYIGIESVNVLHRDLNTKQSYMLFLTPKSSYQILGAKILENGISIIMAGAFFAALAAIDVTVATLYIGGLKEMINLVSSFMEVNWSVTFTPAEAAFYFFGLLASWIVFIVNADLSVILSASVLAGKKGSGIALVNTNRRIRLCFGKEYGIYVYSTYGMGTNVQIHLPRITDRKYLKEIEYEE